MGKVYEELYSQNGGGAMGFRCLEASCKGAVTRTWRGIIMHLQVCHGIRLQTSLDFTGRKLTETGDLPKGIR